MKLLVDANLSPRIATALRHDDHDAVHVSDVDLATAIDTEIVASAEADGFVVVTGHGLPDAGRPATGPPARPSSCCGW